MALVELLTKWLLVTDVSEECGWSLDGRDYGWWYRLADLCG